MARVHMNMSYHVVDVGFIKEARLVWGGRRKKNLPDVCTQLQEMIQTRPRCRDSGDYVDRFETVIPGFPGRDIA